MTSEPSSFGAALLASIHTGASPLQIAHDPDGMLLDEDALARLGERGFAVLRWRDEVTFRFEYETRFRSVWDRGEQASEAAVLLHYDGETPDDLPWDLLNAAKLHRLSLAEWFAGLDLAVVRSLPNAVLHRLYEQYVTRRPGALGAGATADFILVNVYKIADALIDSESEFLRLLLDLHLRRVTLPDPLVDRLTASLANRKSLSAWPVRGLLTDRITFLAFIEDRWPIAVDAALRGDKSLQQPVPEPYVLRIPGPARLPFSEDACLFQLSGFWLKLPNLLLPLPWEKILVMGINFCRHNRGQAST